MTDKLKIVKRYKYTNIMDLRDAVKKYIAFHNDYRPHETLQLKTPNAFEAEYYSKL